MAGQSLPCTFTMPQRLHGIGALYSSLLALLGSLVEALERFSTVVERHLIFYAGVLARLERLQPIDQHMQQQLMRDAVDANFFDWAALEAQHLGGKVACVCRVLQQVRVASAVLHIISYNVYAWVT